MKSILIILTLFIASESMTLFNFKNSRDLSNWNIVDDVVMGGRSDGNLYVSEDGYGIFEGRVSTANNGGFSSVRLDLNEQNIKGMTTAILKVKGDGKPYQFRTKSSRYDRHSYVMEFETSGDWETIEIPLNKMEPRFRGRALNKPNYSATTLNEIAILIGNKKNETFRLEIESIELK